MKPDPMRDALVCALSDLSELYPSMRCGQIVEMVAALTGATTIAEIGRTSDADMLREAVTHIAERSKQLEVISHDTPAAERRQLLDTLRKTPFLGYGPLTGALRTSHRRL